MPFGASNRATAASLIPEVIQRENDGSIPLSNSTPLTAGSVISGANLIQANGTIGDGPYGATSGDVDAFRIRGDADQVLTVDVDSLVFGAGLDTSVALYTSSGDLVGTIDAYNPNAEYDDFRHFTLPASDTYTVVITSWSGYLSNPFDSSSVRADSGMTGDYRAFINLSTAGHENILHGDNTDNTIVGTSGNDVIAGNGGNDVLNGGAGSDLFVWYGVGNLDFYGNVVPSGNDHVDGGAGYDVQEVDGSNSSETFTLAPHGANAVITGTGISSGDMSLHLVNVEGLDLRGLGGDDTFTIDNMAGTQLTGTIHIWGGDGNDTLNAGATNNVIVAYGGDGNDVLTSGRGNDQLFGEGGNDHLTGGGGNDLLNGGAGNDQLWGNAGNDTFIGGSGADAMAGGGGIDTVDYSASAGAVIVDLTLHTASGGDAAGDTLNSIENVVGSALQDTLTGDGATNHLSGGASDDFLFGEAGNDVLDAGQGDDSLHGGDGNDVMIGGAGFDFLFGEDGNDQMWGNDNNDFFMGGGGADAMAGGAGSMDIVDYEWSATGVSVNLATGIGHGGEAEGDTLSSIENLVGSQVDDTLVGSSADNWINGAGGNDIVQGGAGNDFLEGRDGNDILTGGLGHDTLYGGSGSDTYVFNTIQDSRPGSADQIEDFNSADSDHIDVAAIDANTTASGHQDFAFIGDAAFSGVAGQLHYEFTGSEFDNTAETLVSGDVNGDKIADFQVALIDGHHALTAGDFVI